MWFSVGFEEQWLVHNKQRSDLDDSVPGIDSWFLSPRRPAGSLLCDSDAYHSFSHDLILLHMPSQQMLSHWAPEHPRRERLVRLSVCVILELRVIHKPGKCHSLHFISFCFSLSGPVCFKMVPSGQNPNGGLAVRTNQRVGCASLFTFGGGGVYSGKAAAAALE